MEETWRENRRADECDVVVVGAGLVGAAIAAQLSRAGKQVAVLDAQGVAGGATGRSAGLVVAGLPGHYQWVVESFGREQARVLWTLALEGRRRLVETARSLGAPVEQPGSLALAVTEAEAETLRASATLLQEDGFDVQFAPSDPLGRGFLAVLRHPDDAVVDGAAVTRALLSSTPVAVHTNTEVYDLEPDGDGVRVWAHGRTVRCASVVLAVDGYAPLLERTLAQWVAPGRMLLVTTEPLSGKPLPGPCYADYGYEYARPLADGRLLLGAWRRPHPEPEFDESLREGLDRFIARYFPEAQGHIADHRSGLVGVTPDGLPILGNLAHMPQVAFAVGFGSWGMSWALVAADRLARRLLNGEDWGILAVERLDRK